MLSSAAAAIEARMGRPKPRGRRAGSGDFRSLAVSVFDLGR